MFPDWSDDFKTNPFFQAWKSEHKKSVFSKIVGPPNILREEFSDAWIERLKEKIGDGPLTSYTLVNYASYIECMKELKGYNNIKERLTLLDDRFFPTICEIEFLWMILKKTSSDKVSLEYTFKLESGKHPEFMVELNSDKVYFEVTSILNYKEMEDIVKYYNILSAFQYSIKTLHNINRSIKIQFNEYPNINIFNEIYHSINYNLKDDMNITYEYQSDTHAFTLEEGDEVVFNIPNDKIEDKIKDKIEEETPQFDDGNYNFIVIDVTPLISNIDDLSNMVRHYFSYSDNNKIWGVILLFKKWTFDGLEPVYQIGFCHQANPYLDSKKALDIIEKIVMS